MLLKMASGYALFRVTFEVRPMLAVIPNSLKNIRWTFIYILMQVCSPSEKVHHLMEIRATQKNACSGMYESRTPFKKFNIELKMTRSHVWSSKGVSSAEATSANSVASSNNRRYSATVFSEMQQLFSKLKWNRLGWTKLRKRRIQLNLRYIASLFRWDPGG